jgi:small conductance mechanosensitive channel
MESIPLSDLTNMEQLIPLLMEYGTEFGFRLISAAAIFLLGRWLAKLVTGWLKRLLDRTDMEDTLEKFLCNMLYAVLLAAVVIATIGALGVETTSLLAILGAAGLAVGLALQGSLSNFASGVLIVGFRPYRVGDFIEAAGTAGTVEEVQIFTTVLRTGDNKLVIVPNSQIMDGTIVNYSAKDRRRIDLVVGCGYGDDLDHARRVIRQVVDSEPRILEDPAPEIAVSELAESSVNFVVRPWVNTGDYWAVRFAVTEQIKKRFDAEGLSIPFPQRDIHVYQHTPATD